MAMKTVLISMPWADYQYPSIQIGQLAAFARGKGFQVDVLNLHLKMASAIGIDSYEKIFLSEKNIGEQISAFLLFPENKPIPKSFQNKIANTGESIKCISDAIRNIYSRIDWKKYSLAGFTINFDQLFASLLFAKWLKRDFPNIKIVFGGPCVANTIGASILKCFQQVDLCVDGEGEIAFTKILKRLSRHEMNWAKHVPGLIYRFNGDVRINIRKQLTKLNDLPDPDYDDYFNLIKTDKSLNKSGIMPFLQVESSRGCYHRCAFCSIPDYWSGYRARPPEQVAEQIMRLCNKYNTNQLYFSDVIISPRCDERYFAMLQKQKHDYNMFYEIHSGVRKSLLSAMHRAGVRTVQIGIEALSSRLLRKMNKGVRVIDNVQTMKFCEELDIEHTSNMMFNFPSETQQDINESIRNIGFLLSFRPPFNHCNFELRHNSPVYNTPERFGIKEVRENKYINSDILPDEIRNKLILVGKQYSCERTHINYRRLKCALNAWRAKYEQSLLDNQKLLCYYDCIKFIRIEDYRFGEMCITLDGYIRELYLFCDSYKSFNEIIKCFLKWDPREIKKVLNKLVKLKVMFREDDDYLSLAIRANGPK